MKKTIVVLLIALLSVACVFAGNFKFVFKDLDQHPDILYGFLPTLAEIGVGYDGFSLLEGKTTEIQATAGGGFTQRNLFQNPKTGDQMISGFLTYNTTQYRLNLRLNQSLNDSLTAYAGYEARYEVNTDAKQSIDSWFNSSDFGTSLKTCTIYPDVADDKKAFLNTLYAGIIFDRMIDTIVTTDGFLGEFKYQYGSSAINKDALFGSATLNLVASKTLYQKTNEDNENRYSVVLIDRFNYNSTDGTKVPVFISRPVSLGRKVRGFVTNSYNTDRSVVNNLELRLTGPQLFFNNVFPRINLFFDLGYGWGNYINSNITDDNMLSSVGAQFEVCFFDVIDLGFQVSYLLKGGNLKHPGEKIITGATFFLDF